MESLSTKDVSTSISVEKYIYQGFLLMFNPITVTVTKIKCIEESSEVGSDEPYVLVAGIHNPTAPVPNVEVTLYGPWGDIDTGESGGTAPIPLGIDPDLLDAIPLVWQKPFWGLSGKPTVINQPADVIFLVALMENDDGKPRVTRLSAKAAVLGALTGSIEQVNPKDPKSPEKIRLNRLEKAIKDMQDSLDIPTGFPNFDDRIDKVKELKLTSQDLSLASTGVHTKSLQFKGNGEEYEVFFELKKG